MWIDPGHNGTLGWKNDHGENFGVYDLSWKHDTDVAPPNMFVTLVTERNGMTDPLIIYIKTKYIQSASEQLVSGGDAKKITVTIATYTGVPYYLGLVRGYGEAGSDRDKIPFNGLGGKQLAAIYKITAVAPTKSPQVLSDLTAVGAINLTLEESGQLYYANDSKMQWEPVTGQNETRLGFYAMTI